MKKGFDVINGLMMNRFSHQSGFAQERAFCFYTVVDFNKGGVSSYQISLVLPSVAETHPKMYQSRCNLHFSVCRQPGGKILSLENHQSLLLNILGAFI